MKPTSRVGVGVVSIWFRTPETKQIEPHSNTLDPAIRQWVHEAQEMLVFDDPEDAVTWLENLSVSPEWGAKVKIAGRVQQAP